MSLQSSSHPRKSSRAILVEIWNWLLDTRSCMAVSASVYVFRRAVKFREAEFVQYRKCVGGGPSSKTCPRWASQRTHWTSSRTMPSEVSRWACAFSLAIGCQKLGQPVPDSNLVFESKSTVSQQIQLYRPSAWLLAYFPVAGRSVPACRAISNCSGVSCFFHSASAFRPFRHPQRLFEFRMRRTRQSAQFSSRRRRGRGPENKCGWDTRAQEL
jgi:hypothetical protein